MATTYQIQLLDDFTLKVRMTGDSKHIQVRGFRAYGVVHDPVDPLHQFLDTLDPATVSAVMTYDEVTLNPKNTRHVPSYIACDALFARNP